jgi:hypothetical protein
MRTWIGGGILALATSSGLFFVVSGMGNPSHCGPCIEAVASNPGQGNCTEGACPSVDHSDVVEVVNIPAVLNRAPAVPPLVSFEEPPLATPRPSTSPIMLRPENPPKIMQASFIEPIVEGREIEVAPQPRKVSPEGGILLGSPNDPF